MRMVWRVARDVCDGRMNEGMCELCKEKKFGLDFPVLKKDVTDLISQYEKLR